MSASHEHTTEMNTPVSNQSMDDASNDETSLKMIGPLSEQERMQKVLKYLHKKNNKSSMKKFCYKCRK